MLYSKDLTFFMVEKFGKEYLVEQSIFQAPILMINYGLLMRKVKQRDMIRVEDNGLSIMASESERESLHIKEIKLLLFKKEGRALFAIYPDE